MSKQNQTRPKSKAKISSLKGRCPSGKIRFRERREAIAALHRAENLRANAAWDGAETRRNEVRCYTCPDCLGVHLSSLPTWVDRKEAA
jgi:hypothetical protein